MTLENQTFLLLDIKRLIGKYNLEVSFYIHSFFWNYKTDWFTLSMSTDITYDFVDVSVYPTFKTVSFLLWMLYTKKDMTSKTSKSSYCSWWASFFFAPRVNGEEKGANRNKCSFVLEDLIFLLVSYAFKLLFSEVVMYT